MIAFLLSLSSPSAAVYAAEWFILEETFLSLKIRGL